MRVAPLPHEALVEATEVLATACVYDRADRVAKEKLFEPAGPARAQAWAAWKDGEMLGVAAVSGSRVRVLAVRPEARGHGVGTALLETCCAAVRAAGGARIRTLDQPGNYLAPGVDERNTDTIAWLGRRGWTPAGEPRTNLVLDVRTNPRVSVERAEMLAQRARDHGYELRRAAPDETALCAAVAAEFGGAWPYELARAMAVAPAGVHVALKGGDYCAFAAHDGNNRGLGWFGPAGTWPAHRGQRLGEALLLACLVDVAVQHAQCEVAWIGPRAFYDKVAGIAAERRFVVLERAL